MTGRTTVLAHSALALAAYVASAPLTTAAFAAVGAPCAWDRLSVDCDFVARTYDPLAYAALAVVTGGAMLAARSRAHMRAWYPIAMLFGTLVLATTAYDTVMRRPVIGVDRIVDDTFDTMRFAIMASFILVFAISRRVRLPIGSVVAAIVASNLAVVGVELLFHVLSAHVMGTTKLLLLFVLYAFGGFGVHIMCSAWMFASGTMRDETRVGAQA